MTLRVRRGTESEYDTRVGDSEAFFEPGEPVWVADSKLYIGDGTNGGFLVNPTFPDIPTIPDITPNIVAPVTDLTATGPQTDALMAGYTNALFDLVYLNNDGEWYEADANAEARSINMLGLALTVSSDGAVLNVSLPGSFIRNDTWGWRIGEPLYISTTPGAVTQDVPMAPNNVVRTIGYALSADIIFFQPSSDYFVVV